MKFAFCLFNYFPFGGLQRDFLRIAKECVQRGHSVDVFTMHWEGEQDPDLAITILPASGIQNHTRAQRFAAQIQKHTNAYDYDLVVGFNKMPGLDLYYAADTCYQAKARQKHGWFYRLLPRYRHLVKFETSVFAPMAKTEILLISPQQQPEFMHYYRTHQKRFHLLPPGIAKDRIASDNAAMVRAQTRQELGITENSFLLLMVGSGFKTKGLDRILLGIAALPAELKNQVQFYIIGKDKADTFKNQAEQLGIEKQTHFLGGRDDVARFLIAADLLLHPAYNENTGTVLLEAVVSGLPVLTTDVCGYAHYIEEARAGRVLVSPYQQNQFNMALKDMLLSTPARKEWHHNGIAFAKQADLYSMPQRAVDHIESLASERKVSA